MNIEVNIYKGYAKIRVSAYMKEVLYTLSYMKIESDLMKQIGTFRLKVVSAIDDKKLVDGTIKKYKYGSISVKTPKLADYIGKEIMIRVFEEDKEK